MDIDRLRAAYDEIKAGARRVAGQPGDILQRVVAHHGVHVDSRGNHAFPRIALRADPVRR